MKITDEHRKSAKRLVARQLAAGFQPTAAGMALRVPSIAERGYLAAVERIGGKGDVGDEGPDWRSWAGISGPLVLQGVEDLSDRPGRGHALMAPDEARARAFELLVLADLAEGSGGTER